MKPIEEEPLYIAGKLETENKFLKEKMQKLEDENRFLKEKIQKRENPGEIEELKEKEKEKELESLKIYLKEQEQEHSIIVKGLQKRINELKSPWWKKNPFQ